MSVARFDAGWYVADKRILGRPRNAFRHSGEQRVSGRLRCYSVLLTGSEEDIIASG